MRKYTFRPYYAYDCDSEMGFNNGGFLDEITFLAEDAEHARRLAMESLADEFHLDSVDPDETDALGVDAAWTFDHVWHRGESEHHGRNCPVDDGNGDWECTYLYKYLDLGDAELEDAP